MTNFLAKWATKLEPYFLAVGIIALLIGICLGMVAHLPNERRIVLCVLMYAFNCIGLYVACIVLRKEATNDRDRG